MNKGIRIFVVITVVLAILSGIFLLFSKKKTQAPAQQAAQTNQQANSGLPSGQPAAPKPSPTPAAPKPPVEKSVAKKQSADADKPAMLSQWQKCKSGELTYTTTLFWKAKITEAIPAGGTYAKGLLGGESAYPMHIIIKAGISNADDIKQWLVVGKTVLLRGTCVGIDPDGSTVFQSF